MSDSGTLRLGGMALRNGLLVHGPSSWAAAVRLADGSIAVASGRKPRLPAALLRVPFARGVGRVAEAMALLPTVRRGLPGARLPFEDKAVVIAMALSVAAQSALRRSSVSPARTELLSALAAMVPSALALRSGDLAGYHGAEHKAIGAYETGGAAAAASKEHARCGSHLIAPLLAGTAAAQALAARVPPESRHAARAAGSLAALGMAVEVFGWMERHRGSRISRALEQPGFALQRAIATTEPDERQLEVADRALAALLGAEQRALSA